MAVGIQRGSIIAPLTPDTNPATSNVTINRRAEEFFGCAIKSRTRPPKRFTEISGTVREFSPSQDPDSLPSITRFFWSLFPT
jgi:hypothetical protein